MLRRHLFPPALVVLLAASAASGQELSLTIDRGLVTLNAGDVPIREVLARWSEISGMTVLSKGEIADVRVTLQLAAVPEREALADLLRDLSGYIIAGERRDANGVMTVDRLLILSESTPQNAGPAASIRTPSGQMPSNQALSSQSLRQVATAVSPDAELVQTFVEETTPPGDLLSPVVAGTATSAPFGVRNGASAPGGAANGTPASVRQASRPNIPGPGQAESGQPAPATTFGATGLVRPGMIAPVPPPPPPEIPITNPEFDPRTAKPTPPSP